MFHRNIKLILAVAIVAFGDISIYRRGNRQRDFPNFAVIAAYIFYFKNEFILLAFLRLRKQDFPGAQKWLMKITHPETALVRKQQGYFHYLHGVMLSQTNMMQAEKHFKKAIEYGLNMDTDMAIAKLNLAGVAMTRRRKVEATNLLNEAKKLDKHNMLKDQITMMKDQLKKI